MTRAVVIAICLSCIETVSAEEPTLTRYEFTHTEMGMEFKVVLYAADEAAARGGAEAVFARVHELNGVFSDYDADSECGRLSRAAPMSEPVAIGRDMATVLAYALRLSEQSGGAFDVTVGPLTKLWRRARRQHELPPPDDLKTALAAVGYRHVRLDAEHRTVQLLKADMQLDFGGIAAGYAVDEGLALLRKRGIASAMIDASGDIGVSDPPPAQRGWRIGIPPLDRAAAPASRFVVLANAAITTSGDAFQFVEIGGVRYSHIVDPKTGLGLTESRSAAVIARDCITADSVATAACVLGPKQGIALIESLDGAAAIITRTSAGKPETIASRRFAEYEEHEPPH